LIFTLIFVFLSATSPALSKISLAIITLIFGSVYSELYISNKPC
jgi:hypothetical protein